QGRELKVVAERRGIGGQRQHTAQGAGPAQESGVVDHGAALGKTGKENAPGIDAAVTLLLDQLNDRLCRLLQLRLIDCAGGAHGLDVVPARHGPATIDGYRASRRLGQHEARAQQALLQHFGHWLEVVAVGTEAVQPDNAGIGSLRWLDDQGVGHVGLRLKACTGLVRAAGKCSKFVAIGGEITCCRRFPEACSRYQSSFGDAGTPLASLISGCCADGTACLRFALREKLLISDRRLDSGQVLPVFRSTWLDWCVLTLVEGPTPQNKNNWRFR